MGADEKKTKRGRAKGSGNLLKRGGVYRARWMVNGRTFTRTTGTGDRKEALLKLAEFVRPFQAQTDADRIRGAVAQLEGRQAEVDSWKRENAAKLTDAFQLYRDSPSRPNRADAATMDRYEAQFGELVTWLQENRPTVERLNQITDEDAAAFAAKMKQTQAPGTFNKRITLYRSMWEHLAVSAMLTGNPWKRICKLPADTHTRRELTAEELMRVCRPLEGEMRLLFALGLYTGLRLADAILLDWSEVDLVRRRIALVPRKTRKHAHGKVTIIPLHSVLAAMLTEDGARRVGPVMPGLAADFAHDAPSVSRRIQRVFESAGVKTHGNEYTSGRVQVDVGFHSMRHSFVSLCANAGAPLALVQSIVGHSNPSMTRHYFHEDALALKGVVDTLPNIMDGGPENAPGTSARPVGTVVDATDADASEGRFSAFCALWEKMTDAERAQVRDYVGRAHQ